MGEKRAKILTLFTLFIICAANKNISIGQQEIILGKYSYRDPDNIMYISFAFMQDSTFLFEQKSGLDKKYSNGFFTLTDQGNISVKSIYEGSKGSIPPVSWMAFDGEILTFGKNKVYYKKYELSKQE